MENTCKVDSATWQKTIQNGATGQKALSPSMLREITKYAKDKENLAIVDVGSGTGELVKDIINGLGSDYEGLNMELQLFRQKISSYVCIERDGNLHDQMLEQDYQWITMLTHAIAAHRTLPDISENSVDMMLSRMVFMHLTSEELDNHLLNAANVLKHGGHYVVMVTNPDYEQKKVGETLNEEQSYDFPANGGKSTFRHVFRSKENLEKIFLQHFEVVEAKPCFPETDEFLEVRPHYYDTECPVAHLYVLKNKKSVACFGRSTVDKEHNDYIVSSKIGAKIASLGMGVYHGGYAGGLMEAVSTGAVEYAKSAGHAHPETFAKGIPVVCHDGKYDRVPDGIFFPAQHNTERRVELFKNASAFVVLPDGGFGTLREIADILDDQFYEEHPKPVIFVGAKWKVLVEMLFTELGSSKNPSSYTWMKFVDTYEEFEREMELQTVDVNS